MVITKRLGASLKLTRETKISDLLKAYPEMIEILARYNKHFELLRQPALRKLAQSVERGIRQLAGVISANVEVVWGARWNPDMISPEGRQLLAGQGQREQA